MIANVRVLLTIVGFVVLGGWGLGRGVWWRQGTPWVDHVGPVSWVHVEVDEGVDVAGAWRPVGEDEWRTLSFRRHDQHA